MQVTNKQLADILENIADGNIFSCTFVKRTDGTTRKMVCRIGVKKGVKGVGLAYDPAAKRLMGVFDMQNDGFRMLNLNELIDAKVGGVHYVVN